MRGTKVQYAQKMGLDGMASARGHRMQGTEHDIAFSLALGCAIALHCIALHCIALHCIALHCIVAFQDTVQGWVYDRAFFLRVGLCRRFINKTA